MTIEPLATYISNKRENFGMSQIGLAKKSSLPLSTIESIESGQELFLATPIRQKLAKALKLDPKEIKLHEKQEKDIDIHVEFIVNLKEKIIAGDLEGHKCPVCNEELICRVAEFYDLEDMLIRHPKARCSRCPFQVK